MITLSHHWEANIIERYWNDIIYLYDSSIGVNTTRIEHKKGCYTDENDKKNISNIDYDNPNHNTLDKWHNNHQFIDKTR